YLAGRQPERRCRRRIDDLLDDLHFDKMISRSHRAELASPAVLCPLRDLGWITTVEAAVRFIVRDIAIFPDVVRLLELRTSIRHMLTYLVVTQLPRAAVVHS